MMLSCSMVKGHYRCKKFPILPKFEEGTDETLTRTENPLVEKPEALLFKYISSFIADGTAA